MFTFEHTGGPYGDCTSTYNIKLDKPYTVKEFIDAVLSNPKEWGYIGIECYEFINGSTYGRSIFGNPNCEYRHGELITQPLPIEYLEQRVESVRASGGWSRMDYLITTHEGELNG